MKKGGKKRGRTERKDKRRETERNRIKEMEREDNTIFIYKKAKANEKEIRIKDNIKGS